jgi:hypothetical protein
MTVPEKAAVACNLPGQSMSQPASEPPSTQSLRARSHRHVRMTVPGRQAAKRRTLRSSATPVARFTCARQMRTSPLQVASVGPTDR